MIKRKYGLDFRYMPGRDCRKSCSGCYLKQETGIPDTRSDILKSIPDDTDIQISHYVNDNGITGADISKHSDEIMSLFIHYGIHTGESFNSGIRTVSYSMICTVDQAIDIAPFVLDNEQTYNTRIRRFGVSPDFAVSVKSKKDIELVHRFINTYGKQSISLSYTYGVEPDDIEDLMFDISFTFGIPLFLMFKKPLIINSDLFTKISEIMNRAMKYPNGPGLIQIDPCVKDVIDGIDCYSPSWDGGHSPIVLYIHNEGFYSCCYAYKTCKVIIDSIK